MRLGAVLAGPTGSRTGPGSRTDPGPGVTGESSGRPRRWSWRSLLRWAAIVAVTVGGSIVFDLLNVPSPSLFGGLVTGMIFALTTNWRTVLPASVNSGAQAVIGVVLGALLEPVSYTHLTLPTKA